MKKTVTILNNEKGSVMVVVIIMMALLLLMGIMSTKLSIVEMQILRNTILSKQDFYAAEGGVTEVSADVSYADLPGRDCGGRDSCSDDYTITDIETKKILTETVKGASSTELSDINNVKDTTWPTNYADSNNEYAYRVIYDGEGPIPKGYGTGFTSYIFDVTIRKQEGPTPAQMYSTINEGFRKIGPKTNT
ncbi:MAG: pilus assembly PilX N-terminal domain-containing protein [Proteobacteria bacterium]|nr:pilus assembly PilX N-terminal domain-containing protein [Pseudomonadota bacterium]